VNGSKSVHKTAVSGFLHGPTPPLPPPPPPTPSPTPPSQPLCNVDPPNQCRWYNSSIGFRQQRDALLDAMTTDEMLSVMMSRGVERLHVPPVRGVLFVSRSTEAPWAAVP
jgi:hypothetical protein